MVHIRRRPRAGTAGRGRLPAEQPARSGPLQRRSIFCPCLLSPCLLSPCLLSLVVLASARQLEREPVMRKSCQAGDIGSEDKTPTGYARKRARHSGGPSRFSALGKSIRQAEGEVLARIAAAADRHDDVLLAIDHVG